MVLVIVLLVWASCSLLGAWIAGQKRRRPEEGLILGFLFGPLGCLIEALLPNRTAEEVEAEFARRKEEAKRRYEDKPRFEERSDQFAKTRRAEAFRGRLIEVPEDERNQAEEAFRRTVLADRLRRGEAEREARAEAERAAWAETRAGIKADWNRFVYIAFKFGWYRALPEIAQPIVLGLAVAAPIVVLIALALR